jgi:two-component system, NarL family, response regulator NreC
MTAPPLHLARAPSESTGAPSESTGAPSESTGAPSELDCIRVVLADPHPLMRRSLRLLLDEEVDMCVVAEAADVPGVLRQVPKQKPDVLVLDLSMSGGSSIKAIARLRLQQPETQIVALTMDDNPVFARGAFAAGALGFVVKELADSELPEAIRGAAAGERYVSPGVAARLAVLGPGSRPALAGP